LSSRAGSRTGASPQALKASETARAPAVNLIEEMFTLIIASRLSRIVFWTGLLTIRG
jgi:hypothetical protein